MTTTGSAPAMRFGWFQKHARRRILARPMPESWRGWIGQNVAAYDRLGAAERARLEDDTRVFVAEKRFEAGRGFAITDEVRVTIAAQACLITLGFDPGGGVYPNVGTVVVNATGYDCYEVRDHRLERQRVLGHTDLHGPVFLAWDAVRHGGTNPADGRNLVYHEFAHKLDLEDGVGDGTPVIGDRAAFETWVQVMAAAYEQLCDRAADGRRTLLDHYGATNPAEFFAVATEVFFEKPGRMKRRHAALYDVLSRYYRQDPASRGDRDRLTPEPRG